MAKKQKLYSFTDHPEHKAELKPWADKWIANAMSTKPMDDEERAICREAVKGLYRAANLTPPPDNRIIFVPSPFVLRFAGGFSAAIHWLRKNKDFKLSGATHGATQRATRDATQRATYDATHDATHGATHGDDYYECEKRGLIKLAFELKIGKFGLQCATAAYSMWQGGNQWSAWDSFLTFFRHIAKLPIDYSKYDHWEQLALHSGPRIMHPEFCMISDRPVVLKVDDRNRPHCEDGPFCKWSDGSAIYAWDGVFIPKWWIEEKHRLTPEIALHWENIEQRRIACTILGWDKITKDLDGVTIHTDDDPHIGQLIEVDMPDIGKEKFLKVLCGTGREFMLPVPKEMRTAREANAWTYGLAEKDFAPEVRT